VELHLTFMDENDDLVFKKCGKHIREEIGIGNEFLKVARVDE